MFSCTAESQYPLDVDVGRFEIFRRKSNCVSCLIWEKLEMNPIIFCSVQRVVLPLNVLSKPRNNLLHR